MPRLKNSSYDRTKKLRKRQRCFFFYFLNPFSLVKQRFENYMGLFVSSLKQSEPQDLVMETRKNYITRYLTNESGSH